MVLFHSNHLLMMTQKSQINIIVQLSQITANTTRIIVCWWAYDFISNIVFLGRVTDDESLLLYSFIHFCGVFSGVYFWWHVRNCWRIRNSFASEYFQWLNVKFCHVVKSNHKFFDNYQRIIECVTTLLLYRTFWSLKLTN